MTTVMEETNRVPLGKVVLQIAPTGVPAAAPGVVENIINFNIGPTLNEGERKVSRFRMIEVVLVMAGGVTQVDLIPYFSRKNPAPENYGEYADPDADTWQSAGGIVMFATPGLAGGNRTEIAPRGARWVQLTGLNPAGGLISAVDAYLYGIMSSVGGGW